MFRLLPFGLLYFLAGWISRKPRWLLASLIGIAMLVSVLEPLTQLPVLASRPTAMLAMALFIYAYGLIACWQLWRAGPVAPIVMRLAFYAVWHVTLGPWLVAPGSAAG